MKKIILTVSIVFLAFLNLSAPGLIENGMRKLACIEEVDPPSPINFREFPIQPSLLSYLNTESKSSQNQEFQLQARFYSDYFLQTSNNYLAGLEAVRASYGLTGPLFPIVRPISLNPFLPNYQVATTPSFLPAANGMNATTYSDDICKTPMGAKVGNCNLVNAKKASKQIGIHNVGTWNYPL